MQWKISQDSNPGLYNEIKFEAIYSRGPGGQKVNKTNSAVQLRWKVLDTSFFSEEERNKILKNLERIINSKGELVIRSDSFRSQEQNKVSCLKKLENYLNAALKIKKHRIKSKPTRSSIEKRLEIKSKRSKIKSLRSNIRH